MTTPARPLPTLSAVLYRRTRRVSVPKPDGAQRTGKAWEDLEQALGMMSVVLRPELYAALHTLSDTQLSAFFQELMNVSLKEYGAHKRHRPLFRQFPEQTPQDTYAFYLRRLVAFSLRDPGLPCALDGDDLPFGLSQQPSVTPARACVYGMFDPEQFGGCPVCGRVVGPEQETGSVKALLTESKERLQHFITLHLDTDPVQTTRQEMTALLSRTAPLSAQDRDDLRVLLAALGADALPLLPGKVAQRETLALILGTLLANAATRDAALSMLDAHLRTATDLLRVLDVMGGGDASLTGPNAAPRLPRSLRRAFLARLEALDPRNLTEDLQRHPARWKRMGEVLHPFEYARPYPNVAVAFGALRGTTPQADALGEVLRGALATLPGLELLPERAGHRRTGPREAMQKREVLEQEIWNKLWNEEQKIWASNHWKDYKQTWQGKMAETKAQAKAEAVRLSARKANPAYAHIPHPPRLHFTGWAGRVEKALSWGDIPTLLHLLAQRPGELGRRADKLLQVAGAQALPVLRAALPRMTTPMLLLLRSHLAARDAAWPTRLIFPKASAQSFALGDTRPPLGADLTRQLCEDITGELMGRAARLPRFPLAVLDERLKTLPIPFAQRNAARALVTLGRGAALELPQGHGAQKHRARLFVHWMEYEAQRVDLDLSAAFYGPDWQLVGKCDFTNLRFANTGAVHSGDFTSAPAPDGASEFMDLDIDALRAAGVRYAVMTVLCYNGIPFENMAEAFAGYMLREHADGPVFDPRTVEQRYDLRGKNQVSVPLALDLHTLTLHWLDTVPKSRESGVGHQVAAYAQTQQPDALALSARRVMEAAKVGARPTLWDLAYLHATARAKRVWTRGAGGVLRDEQGHVQPNLPDVPTFGAFLFRDLSLPVGSVAASLREQVSDEAQSVTFEALLDELLPNEGSAFTES